MNTSSFIHLALRTFVLLIVLGGLAACREAPTEPEYPEEPHAEAAASSALDDTRTAAGKYSEYLDGEASLYKDAITFTPGSATMWPNNTITVEVSIDGTIHRIGALGVRLDVPAGLSVNGAGSGVSQVVTIPATATRATFQLQALTSSGQVRQLRGTAPQYRAGTMNVRVEHLKVGEILQDIDPELKIDYKHQEPWWWLTMTPANASMQVCDVETIEVERHDIGWNTFDLEVLLNVPAGLSVSGTAIQQTGSGPVLTIPTGSKQGTFDVRADAGSLQPYTLTASAIAYNPADVTIDVAVPSLSLAPSSETILVGQTKPVTVSHNAGTCADVPVTMSAASGLRIAGGASGSAQTVTIPAGAASTSVNLQAVHAGGSPYTVSAAGAAVNPASMTVTVPAPTLDLQVVGSDEQLVHWGQPATYTLEVSGTNWQSQTVELETRGTLPDGITASFSPQQVTLSAAQPSQQVTLTLDTIEGETELYSENNDRPHDIRIRATPVGSSSPSDDTEVALSVLRTNGGFAAFSMGSSTQVHPSGVVGEVSGSYLNFRYNGRTDGPYNPFIGFGISSEGRVGVVHHEGLSSGSGSQAKFVNLRFPQNGFGSTIWSSQNSINGYSAGWFYSPDNSVLLNAARDCTQTNGTCADSTLPLVVTLIDALGGAIGGSRAIGQASLSGSAIQVVSSGTQQTVVLTKANGQTVTWELSN